MPPLFNPPGGAGLDPSHGTIGLVNGSENFLHLADDQVVPLIIPNAAGLNLALLTFEAGLLFAITGMSDDGGGQTLVTTDVDHGLVVGGTVFQVQMGDAGLDAFFEVVTVPSSTSYTIDFAFIFNASGDGMHGDKFIVPADGGGKYFAYFATSDLVQDQAEDPIFSIFQNQTVMTTCQQHQAGINEPEPASMGRMLELAEGDQICIGLENVFNEDTFTFTDELLTLFRVAAA